jgi:dihydroflavonol-4-reductase
MCTLVTGASGHVGNNVVRALLAKGRRVRALVHKNDASLRGLNIESVHGDVRDPGSLIEAFKGAHSIFHLAGIVSIGDDCWPQVSETNVRGTRNVLEAASQAGVSRFVHFSSIHAINQEPFNSPVDETHPFVDSSYPPYDRSKAAGEALVTEAVSRGLNAVVIAPTGIIGPGDYQPSHTGQMLLSLARGTLPALVDGGFDWVDVRDVAEGAILAEGSAQPGAKYLLSGHWASLEKLADIVAGLTRVKKPFFVCPAWLARLGVPAMTVYEKLSRKRPLYTRASIRAVCSNRNISCERAARDFGYHPRPLEETVWDTLVWFKSNGFLPGEGRLS